jgi:hypothetical protein
MNTESFENYNLIGAGNAGFINQKRGLIKVSEKRRFSF